MLSEKIRTFLDDKAPQLVASYFADDGPFAGRTFDALGENPSDRIEYADLVAINMLNVRPSPRFVRWVFADGKGVIEAHLREIPPDRSIFEATTAELDSGSPAYRLLTKLATAERGARWVTARKLLARKRPCLVPVYDSVVYGALEKPDDFWVAIQNALQADEELRTTLEHIRTEAEIGEDIPLLRILDVAIWMRRSGGQYAKAVREEAGVP